MKWLRRAGYGVLALVVAAVPVYWWLLLETHGDFSGGYSIDIAEVRRLGELQTGEKPRLIRVERVGHFSAPAGIAVAGDGWRSIDLPVLSYELVYPDRLAVLDTAFDRETARSSDASAFDGAAYARMSKALGRAAFIIVTHEHPDHVGGLLAQPELTRLSGAARLTRAQVGEIRANIKEGQFAALRLPSDVFDGFRPLEIARNRAIAPGVVLIGAPGHTPGSQMVYVLRADGTEFLFTGDVAWRMRNLETAREKARLATWLAGEDRGRVRQELAVLRKLHAAHPEIHMIPGHDPGAIDSLVRGGLLVEGFCSPCR